jgi:hypothetical protein
VLEFRQGPCPPGAQGEALNVASPQIGWIPSPGDQTTGPKAAPKPRTKAALQPRSAGAPSDDRGERECLKKRQQLDDIDRRLRLGTSGRKGADLRHRRRGLEDFLYERCD